MKPVEVHEVMDVVYDLRVTLRRETKSKWGPPSVENVAKRIGDQFAWVHIEEFRVVKVEPRQGQR